MAKSNTFRFSVITPERVVLECEATFVAFPAHDGEMGVLMNRAPLVCKLGIGGLRVESPQGDQTFFIDGGFAQVVENQLTVLTEQARPAAALDRGAAERAMVEARALRITDEKSAGARARALRRAQVQLRLTGATNR
ncbi:MAG: ATP synthase F1 subunit epsilon [Planctomycetes bacterium]|nr:ATP synthase F1 subunit epsilon [Planctomycetota bacterium]